MMDCYEVTHFGPLALDVFTPGAFGAFVLEPGVIATKQSIRDHPEQGGRGSLVVKKQSDPTVQRIRLYHSI